MNKTSLVSLLDLFRAYPGGVLQLAADAQVSIHTVYRIGAGEHARAPVQPLTKIAAALQGKTVLAKQYSYDDLHALWLQAKESRPAV